jgi:B12-binding domain/radical SAM domain protein
VREEVNTLRKQFGSAVTLIAGGPHASTRPTDLVDLGFDYVVIGEGEHVFPELLLTLMNEIDPETISGVVTKYSDTIPRPKDLPKIALDEYPPFALEMNVVGPIEVTRGCPYSCKFCSTPFLTGSRVRHRSVKTIVHWLRSAVEKRGFRRTWFLSPNALCYGGRGRTVERDILEDLLNQTTSVEGLDEVFYGSFPSEIRPEFAAKDNLDLFRHYVANKTIQIGLQSGSDRVLELANRHHTVSQGMDAVNIALECGFVPHVDMIFGLPGEDEKELGISLELCHELVEMGARVHGHVFMPLPGSAYENMPAGSLDDESRRVLGELARKKLLTGSWSNQEHLAKKLASEHK